MKAMVLAAGLGERMLPLSLTVPKPALPVLGRPLILEILRRLARYGVTSVAVNLHHLPRRLERVLQEAPGLGVRRLHLSHEEKILGTAGGLRHAGRFLRGDGTILVRNSDFLSDVDILKAAMTHRSAGSLATLVLAPARPGYTVIDTGAAGRVLSIGGEPAADPAKIANRGMFTGLHFIEEEVLDLIPGHGASDIVRDVYRPLAAEGRLGSFFHGGHWFDFGSPMDFLDASLGLLELAPEARAQLLVTDPVRTIGRATVALGPGADLHGGVELRGRSVIGLAAMVGEGSAIEDSVILEEAWVGPGCHLRRVVVGPGTELPAGLHIEDMVVCNDTDPPAELPPNTVRRDALLFRPLGNPTP
jgi:NDP-sugar pyrophosphorylase family protein